MRRFTLTEQHIALLRRANVRWNGDCYHGAPEIDPKRPYGNSAMLGDIAEILGYDINDPNIYNEDTDEWGGWLLEAEFAQLHKETTTALQIILATGTFAAGEYECDEYRRNWRAVKQQ